MSGGNGNKTQMVGVSVIYAIWRVENGLSLVSKTVEDGVSTNFVTVHGH